MCPQEAGKFARRHGFLPKAENPSQLDTKWWILVNICYSILRTAVEDFYFFRHIDTYNTDCPEKKET